MLMLIVILGIICLAIAAVGYFAMCNKELSEYRDAITIVCMLAITAVCIFGIFAYDPTGSPPVQSASIDSVEIAEASTAAQSSNTTPDSKSTDLASNEDKTDTKDALELTSTNSKKPGDIFRDCDDCPEMVVVPAGDNNMGEKKGAPQSEPNQYPLAWTHFDSNYAVGRYEVTVREFNAFAAATGFKSSGPCNTDGVGSKKTSFSHPAFAQGPDHPVVCVSMADAKQFAKWLSGKTGEQYTLLSEARWEYARRSVSSAKVSVVANDEKREELGNVRGDNWTASTIEVGRFHANDFLIYDMMGNVAEWTNDCWLENHMLRPKNGRSVIDKGDCTSHAVRGGSWDERAEAARPASRRKLNADIRDWRVGFRIMRAITPSVETTKLID